MHKGKHHKGEAYGMPEAPKPKSRMRVSGPKARKLMDGLKVGESKRIYVTGKVSGMTANDYDDSVEMDVDECGHEGGPPASITKALKARKSRRSRKIVSGHFV